MELQVRVVRVWPISRFLRMRFRAVKKDEIIDDIRKIPCLAQPLDNIEFHVGIDITV